MPHPSRASALLSVVALISLTGGCRSAPQTALSGSAPSPAASRPGTAPSEQGLGVLVMAHGGGEEWNHNVSASVAGLRDRMPLAVAFGMANPHTLQTALDELDSQGASTIAVVRLFLSGASFLHQTEFLFGLPPGSPCTSHDGTPHGAGFRSPSARDGRPRPAGHGWNGRLRTGQPHCPRPRGRGLTRSNTDRCARHRPRHGRGGGEPAPARRHGRERPSTAFGRVRRSADRRAEGGLG